MNTIIRILILIIFLLAFGGAGVSFSQQVQQEWVRRYPDTLGGWGCGNAITTDNMGSVYVTGTVIINNHMNYGTIKYNSEGDVSWFNLYSGNNSGGKQPSAITVDRLSNIYVTGYGYQINNYFDYLTIKYDSSGNEKWVRYFDGGYQDIDQAVAIATDNAQNIYVTGYCSHGGNAFVYGTIKYNPSGDSIWERNYGVPSSSSQPFAMCIDEHCNIYITGMNNNSAATVSYDSSGNLRWANTYPMSWGYSIALDRNDNVFIAGTVSDSVIDGNDYLTIKYTPSGIQQWVRKYTYSTTWSPSNMNSAKAITVDRIGNIYVTGTYSYYYYSGTDFGTTTIKYNSNGDSLWVRRFINAGDYYSSITIDHLNNIYISTGLPDTIPNGGGGYLTIKYDSSGVLGWYMFYTVNCQYYASQSRAIVSDSSGNVYITGGSETPNCFNWWDMTTIKYSQPLFGIKKIGNNIPASYKLFQNYPNPFNPKTKIKYDTPLIPPEGGKFGIVTLKIYDILGKEVTTLVNEKIYPGSYETEWNASNFSSGVYFYQLMVDNKIIDTKKMILIK